MAYKPSPNSLIHCSECDEDYSATYKRCPFCGARNTPPAAPVSKPSRGPEEYEPEAEPETETQTGSGRPPAPADPDDTYVFDGQDLFDGKDDEDYAPVRPKGGKRLAGKSSPKPFANTDINWPRVITFVCSLIIIVAAMVIMFAVILPQIPRGKNPTAGNSESPSDAVTDPGSGATQSANPDVTDPGVEPTPDVPPVDSGELTTIAFKVATDEDFTLQPGESHTIALVFDPENWSGTVTWTSTDTRYATVDANGKVTNVNTTDGLRHVVITASAEGLTLKSEVYCRGMAATQPPVTEPPASEPPVTQPPSGSGNVAVGRQATVVNAASGLNVRSGPGTSYGRIASLVNGNTVNVLEDAGGGWYKISFAGTNGPMEGYVMGDYLSSN